MRKNCKTFEEWCMSQYKDFDRVYKRSSALELRVGSKRATYYATIFNTKTGKAVCETVNMRCGRSLSQISDLAIGLAWASYKGESIPSFKKLVLLREIVIGAPFDTLGGITMIKIGHNPRTNSYVCVPLSGSCKYTEFEGCTKVYAAN